jgi:hypothetical protein
MGHVTIAKSDSAERSAGGASHVTWWRTARNTAGNKKMGNFGWTCRRGFVQKLGVALERMGSDIYPITKLETGWGVLHANWGPKKNRSQLQSLEKLSFCRRCQPVG